MISFVSTKEVLPLRNQILREGKLRDEECIFEHDDDPETFHLGYFHEGRLVTVASFHQQPKEPFAGLGFQLRGMATATEFQGKGFGNMLVNFAIVYLRGQKVNYMWCNARKIAWKFYTSLGFEMVSEEFDIPNIGPHKVMYLKIQ